MSIDTKGLIVAGGIGAAALMLLSRKEDDPFAGMGDFWGGGGGSRETVTTTEEIPTDTVTPTIVLPPVEPYQPDTSIPEWLFSRPAPDSGGGGGDAGGIIARTKKQAAVSSGYTELHENVGATNGFGGGGVGGRGTTEDEGVLGLLGNIVASAFNPVNLFLSATPFGGVAGVLGVATKAAPVFEAMTKKEESIGNNASPFEPASASSAAVASAGYTASGASKKAVSVPSEDVMPVFTAGANYGAAKAVGRSTAGTVYQHSGGARSVVSQGQIVASSSRALDAHDIARLPKKTAAALGY